MALWSCGLAAGETTYFLDGRTGAWMYAAGPGVVHWGPDRARFASARTARQWDPADLLRLLATRPRRRFVYDAEGHIRTEPRRGAQPEAFILWDGRDGNLSVRLDDTDWFQYIYPHHVTILQPWMEPPPIDWIVVPVEPLSSSTPERTPSR